MEGLRLAGDAFDLDLRDGLKNDKIENLRRGFRRDKMIPRSLVNQFYDESTFDNVMAPEYSQPEYALSGSYQPEPSYGA